MNSKKKHYQTRFSTRQFMISKDFELYYYNDFQLSPAAPHKHNYYEFYFFLEGEVSITINNTSYDVHPGDFLVIPPEINHFPSMIDQEKPYRRFVLWVSKEYYNRLMQESISYGFLIQHVLHTKNHLFTNDVLTYNAIQTRLFSLIEEMKGEQFGKEAEVLLQIKGLLLYLNRLIYNRNHIHNPQKEETLYQNICNYISKHLEEDLSLEALAKQFFISKFYISHLFQSNIGLSVHQYILKKRLTACKDAMLGSLPISQLFFQFGFRDYSSFYRAFKKEYGISPKDYKDLHMSERDFNYYEKN